MNILRRPALWPLAAALLLRLGLAVATEINPLFPPHYYNDSREIDQQAAKLLAREGEVEAYIDIPPGSILYTTLTTKVYGLIGQRPAAMKLLNAVIGTAAIAAWFAAGRLACGGGPALLAAWLLALWPSNVFYGSQHMRDAGIQLLTGLSFLLCLQALYGATRGRRWLYWTAAGAGALYLLGLYRPHSLTFAAAALAAAAGVRLLRGPRKRAIVLLGALAATTVSFQATGRRLLFRIQPPPPQTNTLPLDVNLLPTIVNPDKPTAPIYTPRGLSEFRRYRHFHENRWAAYKTGRKVGTQVLTDVAFENWGDVALFLPQGVFYALFMPLPGLYPLEDKLGRWLAAGENLALLVFLCGALAQARRWRASPRAGALAAFFLINALAYGIFEFDLGSATRHRLQYFPALLPLAALFWLRLKPAWERRLNGGAQT